MKMKKRIKQGAALLAALVLAVPAAAYRAEAATPIDTGRECSITFEVSGSFEGLSALEIPVDLYRVAEVDSSGAYTALEGFEGLELEEVSSQTTASEWEEKAALAAEAAVQEGMEPAASSTAEEGFAGLETGMYLVEAREVGTDEAAYRFTPYLLALPGNAYGAEEGAADEWLYDVSTGLKPEQESLLSSIRISKTLESYNETLGGASFIFQVEAVKDGENVYSDVFSLVFDAPGTQSLTVEGIPAGALVTVTEVYSGASYETTGAASQTVTAQAGEENEASFTNTYDGSIKGGSSVVNHFVYTQPGEAGEEGSWTWQQQADSRDVQQSTDVQG